MISFTSPILNFNRLRAHWGRWIPLVEHKSLLSFFRSLLPRINNSLTIPYCQHGLTIQKSELHCNEENFTFDTELYFQPWINLKKSCVFCVHFWFFGEHCPELSKLFKAIFIFAEIKCWQKDQIEVYLEAAYNESQLRYNGSFFSGRLWLINSIITDQI